MTRYTQDRWENTAEETQKQNSERCYKGARKRDETAKPPRKTGIAGFGTVHKPDLALFISRFYGRQSFVKFPPEGKFDPNELWLIPKFAGMFLGVLVMYYPKINTQKLLNQNRSRNPSRKEGFLNFSSKTWIWVLTRNLPKLVVDTFLRGPSTSWSSQNHSKTQNQEIQIKKMRDTGRKTHKRQDLEAWDFREQFFIATRSGSFIED